MNPYYCIELCPKNNNWIQIVRNNQVLQNLVISKALGESLKRFIPSDSVLVIDRKLLTMLPKHVLNTGLKLNNRTVEMIADSTIVYSIVSDCGSTEYRLTLETQELEPNKRLMSVYYDTISHDTYYE